jgi:uroporphyrin-III C-methyltransferase/precorrin-2 dehydrogenase/sirohydrochlorin ferrochelatase
MSARRQPRETKPPRMDALARLPVFFALHGKRVLLAGGNAAAAWKAELLAACGARVDVYAGELSEEMVHVAADALGGRIVLHQRKWTSGDLKNRAIAVGAFDDEREAATFCTVARRW